MKDTEREKVGFNGWDWTLYIFFYMKIMILFFCFVYIKDSIEFQLSIKFYVHLLHAQ